MTKLGKSQHLKTLVLHGENLQKRIVNDSDNPSWDFYYICAYFGQESVCISYPDQESLNAAWNEALKLKETNHD